MKTSASRTTAPSDESEIESQTESQAAVPSDESARAYYIYGIVPADTAEPQDVLGVGDPASPVTLVRHGDLAAVVSDVASGRALGNVRDLRSHAEVLDTMAAGSAAVLPLRFGAVVSSMEAVVDELLVPHEWAFRAALDDLAGCAQFTVRGTYREERLMREVLAARPDIARLREQVGAMPQDAGRYQLIQLGELIAQEVIERRGEDGRVLLDRLGPLAEASTVGDPGDSSEAVNGSFLVRRGSWSAFEDAAEELARSWAERIDLRMLGPLAPYDFVTEVIEAFEDAGAPEGGREPWV